MAYVTKLNKQLKHYPSFKGENQKLGDDKLLEILEFGIPSSWQCQMSLQHLCTSERTLQEIIDFCMGIEAYKTSTKICLPKLPRHPPRPNWEMPTKREMPQNQYYELHGPGKGHSTGECKVFLAQAKQMQLAYDNKLE